MVMLPASLRGSGGGSRWAAQDQEGTPGVGVLGVHWEAFKDGDCASRQLVRADAVPVP